MKELIHNAGELIITGFPGLTLSKFTASALRDNRIGGVILFSENYEHPKQVRELIQSIQKCRHDLPMWISVDHEGGQVQRFRNSFSVIPEAVDLASKGSTEHVYEISSKIANELHAVGININYAPVADINTNPKNPIIGRRAFGDDADTVSKFVSAFVRGHLSNKVHPVVKHFPGHGDTITDSHFDLPVVHTKMETLRKREFKPFIDGFAAGCKMVMTAHVLVPEIDPDFPATLSSKFLRDILRGECGYNDLIISDDLEMKAISDRYGATESPILSLKAGCDLLIYKTLEAALIGLDSVREILAAGPVSFRDTVQESIARSKRVKREWN